MGLSFANLDIGGLFGGLGTLAKDIRTAITGKEPISADKAAELALKVQELEASLEQARLSVMVAEASSADPWTSRARPAFLYVVYIMLLASIPMGIISAIDQKVAVDIAAGFTAWLKGIPADLYALFGAGYLGYAAVRTYDKKKG
ncbi:MAG: holin family protein [Methanothrix sp.]|nr:holin family protein [Methanothrix sp.]